jgi:hypothetical protein
VLGLGRDRGEGCASSQREMETLLHGGSPGCGARRTVNTDGEHRYI